jgi:ferrous iron transport protein B
VTTVCHDAKAAPVRAASVRITLVGAPNTGKTSIFNALTGMRAKTGNYPGVTVSRSVGALTVAGTRLTIEDLPGTYSLVPVSPDEQIVVDALGGRLAGVEPPDALLVVVDATTLRRSLTFVAQVLALGRPASLVVTFTDELARRQGKLDVAALSQAVGVPVHGVVGHRGRGIATLRAALPSWRSWAVPVILPPTDPSEVDAWANSVLEFAGYQLPIRDRVTARVDAVLLHPVCGPLVFLAVMVAFFQAIFVLASPLQGYLVQGFDWLSGSVADHVHIPWLAGLLGNALIGGVGGVLVFLPQIVILFLLIALLEGVGYLPRAAFVMDRVMARVGLEGRAFVALLSSVACAVPGIMATRTLPSARDRLATMMAAPLMTCSARLPVYVLLVGMLVGPAVRVGPMGVQGLVMFGLYLLGGVSAMVAAWVFKRIGSRHRSDIPFYMEIPPYRLPSLRSVVLTASDSARTFLRKCSTIIVATSIVLWLLLNLPLHSTVDHSLAGDLGRLAQPLFAPLGFDWRVNVGVLSAQAARETFVATMNQVGGTAGLGMPTVAALLVWFVYALQCMNTVAALRRETGGWRWPLTALSYLTAVAWAMAFLTHAVVAAAMG